MSLPRTCPLCQASVEPTANFCSGCGAPLTGSGPGSAASKPKWFYNIWVVLFLLLFVLGPFVLPLVWRNPRFSKPVKLVLTLLAFGYTVLMLVMVGRTLKAVQGSIDAFNSTLQF